MLWRDGQQLFDALEKEQVPTLVANGGHVEFEGCPARVPFLLGQGVLPADELQGGGRQQGQFLLGQQQVLKGGLVQKTGQQGLENLEHQPVSHERLCHLELVVPLYGAEFVVCRLQQGVDEMLSQAGDERLLPGTDRLRGAVLD